MKCYVASIFKHKCIDVVRRKIDESAPINKSLADKLPEETKGVIEVIIANELRSEIYNCYQKIGEGCKEVLMLFAEGVKDKEIAGRMAYKSAEAARQKRYACFRTLRDCLSPAAHG